MPRVTLPRVFAAAAIAIGAGCAFALIPALAADTVQPSQGDTPKKVWTNDDVHALERIPLAFESETVAAAKAAPSKADTSAAARSLPPKQRDPGWYRVQVASLRGQLSAIEARQKDIHAQLDSHRGGTQGLNLMEDSEGVTPQSALEVLEARRRAVLSQIDALEDLAHRNGIPPGELRREPSPADYAADSYMQAVLATPEPPAALRTELEWRARFAELRLRLARAKQELEILQRELGVAYVQYYPDPMKTLKEEYTFREVNQLRARIAAKKAEIGMLEQQISDLRDDLRRADLPPGWAR